MRTSSHRVKRLLVDGVKYLLLCFVVVLVIFPFLWMVSGSLKGNNEVLSYPPTFIPQVIRWENYAEVFVFQPFAQQFLNSVIVMTLVCAITLCVSTMAGYAFARVPVKGASIIFLILLTGIFIPGEATIVPLYRMVTAFGWIDSLTPLIVITSFVTTAPVATFVMRQSFLSLSPEYGEAATIDGAGRWRTFLQVYLPMVRPSMAAVIVLTTFYSWNEFLGPLIFLRSRPNFTVPLAIAQYEDPFSGPLWAVQLAAATLSVIPVLVVFFIAQKHVVAGLTAGGLKA
jgi:multiple sugar transport system permease protein